MAKQFLHNVDHLNNNMSYAVKTGCIFKIVVVSLFLVTACLYSKPGVKGSFLIISSEAAGTDESDDAVVSDTPASLPDISDADDSSGPHDNTASSGNELYDQGGPGASDYTDNSGFTATAEASQPIVPGSASAAGPDQDSSYISNIPGVKYLDDAKHRESIGFMLVQPAYDYNGINVAEGSVQLADGSWAAISHSDYLKSPYYKLIKTCTDNSGTLWYVCRATGNQFGAFTTPDGSVANEIWLKASDCTTTDSMEFNTTNEKRINIVKSALSLLGLGYTYGGCGPKAFDCSGLVQFVMNENGIDVPRSSSSICDLPNRIEMSDLRPGDIIGRPGHVGIYIGNDMFIHASESSTGIVTEKFSTYNAAKNFTTFINVAGD